MARRLVMQLVADATLPAGRFHVLIALEGTWTGDNRMFEAGSLGWRDLPLPLMAIDKTTWEHQEAILVGNITEIEKVDLEVHGYGDWIAVEEGSDAERLIGMIQRKELRGLSADIDDVEFEVLFPVDPEEPEPEETVEEVADEGDEPAEELPRETDEETGQEYIVLTEKPIRLRVTEGRIMGATVVPFPALQECFIEPTEGGEATATEEPAPVPALAASAGATLAAHMIHGLVLEVGEGDPAEVPQAKPANVIVAASNGPRESGATHWDFPAVPPREWFEVPETDGPMPLTILDSGQVFGHIAVWGECHVGITGECVNPPESASNYARFHVGEIAVDDGSRIAVGRLTFGTGHAARGLRGPETIAHYDNTGTQGAYIVASDGEYGIWCCGAAKAGLTDAQVQELLSAPPSGDWRRFGQHLEMVGVLAVNVPGFNEAQSHRQALVRREEGLVASLILSNPAPPREPGKPSPAGMSDAFAARLAASARASIAAATEDLCAQARHRIEHHLEGVS